MQDIKKYVEKPRQVEACPFDGETSDLMACVAWVQENGYVWYDMFTPAPARGVTIDPATGFLIIINRDGRTMSAEKGQHWLVKGVDGSIITMPADEFNATYKEAGKP